MQIRKLPVAQGLAWFRAAIDLGARNPKAVFGAALLFIAVLYGLAILLTVVAMALGGARNGGAPDASLFLMVFVPLFVGMMVLLPILIGGLMHVIREAEAGRPVRARDLFAPLRTGRAKGPVLTCHFIDLAKGIRPSTSGTSSARTSRAARPTSRRVAAT